MIKWQLSKLASETIRKLEEKIECRGSYTSRSKNITY